MNGPHSEEFFKEMEAEMKLLESNMDPWEVVPREEAGESSILDSTWAFKSKRFPDRRIQKYKARICVRGDQQEHGFDLL